MNTNAQIVVLDDDPMVASIIEKTLGSQCISFPSLSSLFDRLPSVGNPKAFFIDIHLGATDCGLQAIPQLRERFPFCPILVVTGDPDERAVVEALACGADDFIQKPIRGKEMISRLQSRAEICSLLEEKSTQKFADLCLNTMHRRLYNTNKEVYLSPSATAILTVLLELQGSVVSRELLKRRAWGKINISDNALNRKIFEVRRAIKDVSTLVRVENVYGDGFTLSRRKRDPVVDETT